MALALLAWLAVSSGCAAKTGWSVTEQRTCEPAAAPRVCVLAQPDHGHVIELADVEMLPGECAASPRVRGGLVRVEARDPSDERRGRWLAAPRGRTTILRVHEGGEIRARRSRCDQTPVMLDEHEPQIERSNEEAG